MNCRNTWGKLKDIKEVADLNNLHAKIFQYLKTDKRYNKLSVESAISKMVQDGILTKKEYDQLIKTSAFGFGYGFNSDFGDVVEFNKTKPLSVPQSNSSEGIATSNNTLPRSSLGNFGLVDVAMLPVNYQIVAGDYTILSQEYYNAYSHLHDIFSDTETSFSQQLKNEGWISDFINGWREFFNKEHTRTDVSNSLKETRSDLELLDAAMRGALIDGNGNNVDFETAFQNLRGVPYSKEKIEICQKNADVYAQADTINRCIEELCKNLEKFSRGSTNLQNVKEFNTVVLKTFSMLGITDQGQINEALKQISQEIGLEIKLVKLGTKDKEYYKQDYALMFENDSGKFVSLTPEIAGKVAGKLINNLQETKYMMLGLPANSTKDDCEKYVADLKTEYEQSFKEAYGKKDVSILAQEYIEIQQKRLMHLNIGATIGLIALSMVTGGATAGLATAMLLTQPLQLVEMLSDDNGTFGSDLLDYGKMLLCQLPWMGAGIVVGKIGDLARGCIKLKGLQGLAAKSGQSLDDFVKTTLQKGQLSDDVATALKITRGVADVTGMGFEMALDLTVTKLVQPEGATHLDWIMAFIGALAGSSLNKTLFNNNIPPESRAGVLMQNFSALKLTENEAMKIVKTIDKQAANSSNGAVNHSIDNVNKPENIAANNKPENYQPPKVEDVPVEAGVLRTENQNIELDNNHVKLNSFEDTLKSANLDDIETQKQMLAELEKQYPSTRGIPGRVITLKEIKNLINSPEYLKLNTEQRQIAQLTILKSNPRIDIRKIYKDSNISIDIKRKISTLESCLKEDGAQNAAAIYKQEDFDVLMILAKNKNVDEAVIKQMSEAYNKANSNGCMLVNNTPVNFENVPKREVVKEGKSYNVAVIDCSDSNVFKNPEKYGFPAGTTPENLRLTVHMNDDFNKNPQMTIGKMEQSEDLNLSATTTNGENALYGMQQVGIGLVYDSGSVGYASNYSAGTGFIKNIESLANARLSFDESSNATFVRDRFIQRMNTDGYNITAEDYAVFSRQFSGKPFSVSDLDSIAKNGMIDFNGKQIPLEQVKTSLTQSSDDLMNVSYEMRGQTISNGMNEINVENPTIAYIYVRANFEGETVNSILSPQMLEYAEKHNIPIVFQSSKKKPPHISKTFLQEPGNAKKTYPSNIKTLKELTPKLKSEEIALQNSALIKEIDNPNKSGEKIKVLTDEADNLAWKAAEDIRNNALLQENKIVSSYKQTGLVADNEFEHRSKSLQSLHDKIKNYILENPEMTLEDAIRDVRDGVALRTINKSKNINNHPDVVKFVKLKNTKEAINKAIEIESDYVMQGLKGIVDKMADGTAEFSISRISNYMGEDGVPYFTEKQLNDLRVYAESKGVNIPIVSRINEAGGVNENATTKIRKSGYTALQINFITKNGDVIEWQYRGDKLNTFGEGEHIPYDLRTGKDFIGKDTILTDLYKPLQDILLDKNKMSDDLYKEYNAYLTAHYRYLRMVELGFENFGNPPKLPKGIDERLRADNLDLIHDLGEGLKKGDLTIEEALEQYELRLVRNTSDNVTTASYRKKN